MFGKSAQFSALNSPDNSLIFRLRQYVTFFLANSVAIINLTFKGTNLTPQLKVALYPS
jgi:hypothetical protein